MRVAGQKRRAPGPRSGEDDRIGGRELVRAAGVSSRERGGHGAEARAEAPRES